MSFILAIANGNTFWRCDIYNFWLFDSDLFLYTRNWTFKTSYTWVQIHHLNLCSSAVNSQRLLWSQKDDVNFFVLMLSGIQKSILSKDKRMIILYAVPISLWPMLGKENRYFYTRYPKYNDHWSYLFPLPLWNKEKRKDICSFLPNTQAEHISSQQIFILDLDATLHLKVSINP